MEIAALAMISASTISAERGDCTQRRNPLCAPETALWSEKSENVRQTEKTMSMIERNRISMFQSRICRPPPVAYLAEKMDSRRSVMSGFSRTSNRRWFCVFR